MEQEVTVENGDKKVRVSENKHGIYLSVTSNGYQWSSLSIDEQLLDMIEQAVTAKQQSKRGKRKS